MKCSFSVRQGMGVHCLCLSSWEASKKSQFPFLAPFHPHLGYWVKTVPNVPLGSLFYDGNHIQSNCHAVATVLLVSDI